MSARERTIRLRHKPTGKVYWVQVRTGFRGREYNFGGGWRTSPAAAQEAAEKSGALSEAPAGAL
jgi:hypothetical protein